MFLLLPFSLLLSQQLVTDASSPLLPLLSRRASPLPTCSPRTSPSLETPSRSRYVRRHPFFSPAGFRWGRGSTRDLTKTSSLEPGCLGLSTCCSGTGWQKNCCSSFAVVLVHAVNKAHCISSNRQGVPSAGVGLSRTEGSSEKTVWDGWRNGTVVGRCSRLRVFLDTCWLSYDSAWLHSSTPSVGQHASRARSAKHDWLPSSFSAYSGARCATGIAPTCVCCALLSRFCDFTAQERDARANGGLSAEQRTFTCYSQGALSA